MVRRTDGRSVGDTCHKLFSGDAIVEQDIKERALAWGPPAMRFEPPAPDELEEHKG